MAPGLGAGGVAASGTRGAHEAGARSKRPRARLGPFALVAEDIRTILERDPAARSRAEVLLCYPGLHAVLVHRLAHRLWKGRHFFLARLLSQAGRAATGIEIHPGATIGRRFFIDHGMGVVIGETAEVGDDVTLYQGVTLGGTSLERAKRHPTLADGVIVGAGASVLGALLVGERARIGAGAIVVKDVPAAATVVGLAGRVLEKHVPGQPAVSTQVSESRGDHEVRVIEVLMEKVEQLESRMVDGELSAPEARPGLAAVAAEYGEGAGI